MKYNLHIVRGGLESKLHEKHCRTCTCSDHNTDNYGYGLLKELESLAGTPRNYGYGIFIGGPYDDVKPANNNSNKKTA